MADDHSPQNCCRIWGVAVAFGLLVAACGGNPLGRSDAPASADAARSSPSMGERISSLFSQPPSPQASSQAEIPPEDIDCPTVDIRVGAATFTVSAGAADASPMNLRYQAVFDRTARECRARGGMLTMKVGVEGRVIVGPAGSAGEIDLPLRYAVVQEGPEPKTIVTKLRRFKVTIPPEANYVPFMQIEEDLSFPLPRGGNLEAYVVYIGFDHQAVTESKKPPKKPKKPAPAPRRNI